jgi:predicted membrane channel-forming protein YqfA (hemolysin III family)
MLIFKEMVFYLGLAALYLIVIILIAFLGLWLNERDYRKLEEMSMYVFAGWIVLPMAIMLQKALDWLILFLN